MPNASGNTNGQYIEATLVGKEGDRYKVRLSTPYEHSIQGRGVIIQEFVASGKHLRPYLVKGTKRDLKLPVSYLGQVIERAYEKRAAKTSGKSVDKPEQRQVVDTRGMSDLDKELAERGFTPDNNRVLSDSSICRILDEDSEDGSGYNLEK